MDVARISMRKVTRAWVILGVVVAGILGGLAALVYLVATILFGGDVAPPTARPAPSPTTTSSAARTSAPAISLQQAEDALAAKPMVQLLPAAAQPQPLVEATAGPPIVLPKATVHTELVATGFPRTPEGAVAQLAVIDQAAMQNLSRAQVALVYKWAAMPGAVPQQDWNMTVGVNAGLRGAGLTDSTAGLQLSYTVTHAQLKGSLDGGNFVVACVLGEIDINYRNSTRFGVGDCQRMVWSAGRWRIGPGPQPAWAPSAWPGSADSVRAGWQAVKHA
jgi:hypothetical protein